jgi:hypothetical protein
MESSFIRYGEYKVAVKENSLFLIKFEEEIERFNNDKIIVQLLKNGNLMFGPFERPAEFKFSIPNISYLIFDIFERRFTDSNKKQF